MANADKARCRKARPSERGRELEAWCAVQGLLFSNLFIDLFGYIYLSSCVSFPLQTNGFFFSFFFLFKLIDWCFTFENLFEVVNFYSDNFLLTHCDLTDCFLFQFYQKIIIFLLCLFVCVVLFSARRKICLGLLKKVLFSLSGRKRPMAKLYKEKRSSKKLPLKSCSLSFEMCAGGQFVGVKT